TGRASGTPPMCSSSASRIPDGTLRVPDHPITRSPDSLMPYFLDGNNLIGRERGTALPSEEDRQALVAELAGRLRRTKATAALFFDGPGERRSCLGRLSIREGGRTSADEAILAEIGRSRAPREIVVVTEDRGL